ncbi:MAG: VWA domain-containing protein [Methanobacteriaceae archaeon]|nr:VWA domain-containing protein [Methanobacteriaceae archaeon]
MMENIIEFSGLLRKNGIPASIRSTLTALEAIKIIDDNEDRLRQALASIYIKDPRHQEIFNKLFESVFVKKITEDKEDLQRSKENENSNEKRFVKKYKVTLKTKDVLKKIKDVKINEIDYNPLLDDYINPEPTYAELLERDITSLNSFQPEIYELCQKLGRKIANKRVRRLKQSKNNKPDIRRTIRKNLKYGGTLIDLVKSKPRIKKSSHFFLNDVSGSCDWISNWFFFLIYSAQNSFHKARVFDYDNKTVEISSALTESSLLSAFIKVRESRQKNLMIHGTSNMYQSFKRFYDMVHLNNKSNVIILSDCRDWAGPKLDGKPLSAEIIEEMTRRSRSVLILNPEPKNKWNVVDSCVSHYENAGAKFFEVRNLKQLADFITEI